MATMRGQASQPYEVQMQKALDAATKLMDQLDLETVSRAQPGEEPLAFNCFGTAGTLGTFCGCGGTFGTFGCHVQQEQVG
jgi:hypothetical protein